MQSFTLDDAGQATSAVRDQRHRVQRRTRAAAGAVERRPMHGSMARKTGQFMGRPLVVVMVAAAASCRATETVIADAVPGPERPAIEGFNRKTGGVAERESA
ncbi:hypothetical protein EA796_22375 [Pseudomonas sp. AOB-7]|nr:hypothetical protein EA796_22375 [Pseudomonas sp. AOB-7]